jgi:hypothetical protein
LAAAEEQFPKASFPAVTPPYDLSTVLTQELRATGILDPKGKGKAKEPEEPEESEAEEEEKRDSETMRD